MSDVMLKRLSTELRVSAHLRAENQRQAVEIERLRAAGDRLAKLLGDATGHEDMFPEHHTAIAAWWEARE